MSLPVSIIILTYNEEDAIGECIQAAKNISTDIHVLDSDSTDSTLDVVRELGVPIYQNRFTGFGDQRNWAIDHIPTRFPWHLHLDADERPTPEFIAELKRTLQSETAHAGFRIPNRLMLGDRWLKHSSGYPVYQVRLFHRDRLRFENAGHGQKEVTSGSLGYFHSAYLHYGLSKGLQAWFEKHCRYAHQEAKKAAEVRLSIFDELRGLTRDSVTRRRAMKRLSYRVPCRAWFRWCEILFLRGGILDGKAGIIYANMIYAYESMASVYLMAHQAGIETFKAASK